MLSEAEIAFEELYDSMSEDIKKEFEHACISGDIQMDYNYIGTIALNDPSEATSDYIQMNIAEGEMIKEIDNALYGYDIVVEQLFDDENMPSMSELYNQENISRSHGLKQYFKYYAVDSARGDLKENERIVPADRFAVLLAQLNYKDDVRNIAKMFGKKIDISKIEQYQNIITKENTQNRSASSGAGFYDNSLISDEEIQKSETESVLKTGQIVLRRGKLKNDYCFYGTFDHAGIVDLRNYISKKRNVTADLWSKTVLSVYPEGMKDSMPGDRCPEKVGYPSFEPIINFSQGKRFVLLEPIDTSKMEAATDYVVSRKNKCNTPYNFVDAYCSYMPYYGYKNVGININSDVEARTYSGIVTPDDIHGSINDIYGYGWYEVWMPMYGLRWFRVNKWWKWELRIVQTGRIKVWNYGSKKIFSKSTIKVLDKEQ